MSNGKVVYCSAFGENYLGNVDNVNNKNAGNWNPVLVTNVAVNTETYNGWNVMQIKNRPGLTNVKMARWVKTHPHILFPNDNISLWLDTKFAINVNLDEFAERYLFKLGCKMTFMDHHKRNCIYEEAKTLNHDFADQPNVVRDVNKQIEAYRSEGFPYVYGLFSTGILLRLHNDPDVKKFMDLWFKEIRKYSQRDMISLPYIMWKHPKLYADAKANIINFKKTYEMFINRR